MKGIIIIFFVILCYCIIGNVILYCFISICEEKIDEDSAEAALITVFWPIFLLLLVLFLISIGTQFISKKLSVIPVAIIKWFQRRLKNGD